MPAEYERIRDDLIRRGKPAKEAKRIAAATSASPSPSTRQEERSPFIALENVRRVELLTKRLNGSLSALEDLELEGLQKSEGARFGVRLRSGNERLRNLLLG